MAPNSLLLSVTICAIMPYLQISSSKMNLLMDQVFKFFNIIPSGYPVSVSLATKQLQYPFDLGINMISQCTVQNNCDGSEGFTSNVSFFFNNT
jgi:hypothetical protein